MALGDRWREAVARAILRVLPKRVRRAIDDVSGPDLLLHAAALAFYAMVSVVPLTALLMWLASVAAGESRVQQLSKVLADIAPQDLGADRALRRVAELGNRLGIAAAITALWPATAYGSGLARGFRSLSPKPTEEFTGLWGRGLIVLGVLPLLVVGTMLATFAAPSLISDGVLRVVGYVLGVLGAFLGAAGATAIIYRVFPPENLPWRKILRGTSVAAGGVAILAVAFALIIGLGANFGQYYAISGIGAIVLVALWLFLANALLLLGYLVALRR